jgi:hypothetical protein
LSSSLLSLSLSPSSSTGNLVLLAAVGDVNVDLTLLSLSLLPESFASVLALAGGRGNPGTPTPPAFWGGCAGGCFIGLRAFGAALARSITFPANTPTPPIPTPMEALVAPGTLPVLVVLLLMWFVFITESFQKPSDTFGLHRLIAYAAYGRNAG